MPILTTRGGQWVDTTGAVHEPGDRFQLGVTEPTLANTGNHLPPLDTTTGRLSASGVIEGRLVTEDFRPNGPGVMRHSTIRNGQPASMQAMVDVRSLNVTGQYRLEHVTLEPSHPTVHTYGLRWAGIDAYRCTILGCVDAAQVYGTNSGGTLIERAVTISGCLLGDSPLYQVDPQQGGGPSHNDGIQAQGGITELQVIGSAIGAVGDRFDACVLLQTSVGQYGSVTITDNWLYGHQTTGSILNMSSGFDSPLEFKRNRISRDSYLGGQILVRPAARIASSFGMVGPDGDCSLWTPGPDCNVYMDNGEPVYPKNN